MRLSCVETQKAVKTALEAHGCSEPTAKSVARALVRAEAEGHVGHGLRRLPSYLEQIRAGKVDPNAQPTLAELAPGLVKIDAAGGFAYPAIDLAVSDLKTRAVRQGVAAAAVTRSHHCGVAGHAVATLAEAECAALLFANTPAAMALAGGRSALLGTNPIAFAVPSGDGPPLVIDLSLSVVARGKIMAAQQAGESLQEGLAYDSDGVPTTDPNAALDGGTLAAIGGAKGACLALMVEILAAGLTRSHYAGEASSFLTAKGPPPHTGQMLIALSIEALGGARVKDHLAALCAMIDAEVGARRPGDHRQRNLAAEPELDIPDVVVACLPI